jgi:hypothetical protein
VAFVKNLFLLKKNKEITNLLGIVFFLQVVSDLVPPSSMGIPKLCNYVNIKEEKITMIGEIGVQLQKKF